MQEFLIEIRQAANLKNCDLRIIPCGGRQAAYNSFASAIKVYPKDYIILLVDSEDTPAIPPNGHLNPVWFALKQRDGWAMPPQASDLNCYLMVNAMEAWLLSDPEKLESYYKNGFQISKIPTSSLENRNRQDLLVILENATRKCNNPYKKSHAFDLIGSIRKSKVCELANGDRLFKGLENIIAKIPQVVE